MIPKPNLDDKTFDDIVSQAIRLIPRYCPEWTNHNPTDPGMTLVELFAWMTEMTLYRLNRVPEKTYLSLLELMGLSLIPAQSARVVVRFYPVEGYRKPVQIPEKTQVAAVVAEDTCLFETEKRIQVHNSSLVSCVNRIGESWSDFCVGGELESFTLFDANASVEHVLYVSSPLFAYLSGENYIQVAFSTTQELSSVRDEIVHYLYWEYWDGRTWVNAEAHASYALGKKRDNTVYIAGPIPVAPCGINGVEGLYLRAVLSEVPKKHSVLSVCGLTLRIFFGGSGFIPDLCLLNSGSEYAPVDMNGTFRLFSESPGYNEIFYIASDEIFKNTGTRVRLVFTFSELYVAGEENEDALFAYEYWDGNNWARFEKESEFADGTFGFRQSGEVSMLIPKKCKKTAVNNEERYWLRIRLVTKDFSIGGAYVRDEKENWVWQFTKKVHSPLLSRIRIIYESKPQIPDRMISNSNFAWNCLGELCSEKPQETPLFSIFPEQVPSLYLGFSDMLPQGDVSLYIKTNESASVKPKEKRLSFFDDLLANTVTEHQRLIDLFWEYWNGTEWYPLSVSDFTDSFHEPGFIDFITPKDITASFEFGKELVWLRVSLLSGSFERQPLIESILTNAVYAKNSTAYINETAGSGTGAPGQTLQPAHSPLLQGMLLSVDEGSFPSANEVESLKVDGIRRPVVQDGDCVWVPYREVDNFYNSTPFSRHYVVDYQANRVYFGDGMRGVCPPRKKFNIRLDLYETGGGSRGNVAAHTLRILSKNIPFIAGCDNPFAAEGGADMESVDSLKSRAAGVFKSLQRAVTAEDFEWLSRESSASVAKACCLKEKNRYDEVVVLIIPVIPGGGQLSEKLLPSRELLRRVTEYLDARKLVGTRIRVQEPLYRSFSVFVSLSLKSGVADEGRTKRAITDALYEYFHALVGGSGDGWETGKTVTGGAVLKLLEKIGGILFIDKAELFDEDAQIVAEKLILKPDELPFLTGVTVETRKEE